MPFVSNWRIMNSSCYKHNYYEYFWPTRVWITDYVDWDGSTVRGNDHRHHKSYLPPTRTINHLTSMVWGASLLPYLNTPTLPSIHKSIWLSPFLIVEYNKSSKFTFKPLEAKVSHIQRLLFPSPPSLINIFKAPITPFYNSIPRSPPRRSIHRNRLKSRSLTIHNSDTPVRTTQPPWFAGAMLPQLVRAGSRPVPSWKPGCSSLVSLRSTPTSLLAYIFIVLPVLSRNTQGSVSVTTISRTSLISCNGWLALICSWRLFPASPDYAFWSRGCKGQGGWERVWK